MECKKCGKKVTKSTKFCTNCGEEVIFEEKKTTSTKAAKAVKARAEKVEAVKVEEPKKEVKKESNGLAIAGMVLGIVGLVFTLILNVASILIFLLPLLGLIFSIVAKGKKGFKIAGLVTSIIAIILEVLFLLLGIFVFSSFMSIFGEYIGNSSRGEEIIDFCRNANEEEILINYSKEMLLTKHKDWEQERESRLYIIRKNKIYEREDEKKMKVSIDGCIEGICLGYKFLDDTERVIKLSKLLSDTNYKYCNQIKLDAFGLIVSPERGYVSWPINETTHLPIKLNSIINPMIKLLNENYPLKYVNPA